LVAGKTIEREGVKVAMRYLRAQGYEPRDMGTRKVGHDIRLGRKRIEVKASEKGRAWMDVDIRGCCHVTVNKNEDRAVVRRKGLNIDGLVEVTRMGEPGGPVVYFYPKQVVKKYGRFHVKPIWDVLVPPEEREKYRLRRRRRRHQK